MMRLPDEKIIYPDKYQPQYTLPEYQTENNNEPEIIYMFPPEPPVCKFCYADQSCNDKQKQNEFIISSDPIGFCRFPDVYPSFHLQSFAEGDPGNLCGIINC